MSFRIMRGLLDAGPSVATIFTLRNLGSRVSLIRPSAVQPPGNSGWTFWFNRVERRHALA
ncbi:MAG: hypothetical protein ACR2JJ_08475 [Sphingomicrobium sp.]